MIQHVTPGPVDSIFSSSHVKSRDVINCLRRPSYFGPEFNHDAASVENFDRERTRSSGYTLRPGVCRPLLTDAWSQICAAQHLQVPNFVCCGA
jgi:hypothetical protein